MAVRATNKIRIMLDQEIALGPGKADLLEAIQETGSISGAARRLGMSYKRAWDLVEELNTIFGREVLSAQKGGRHGGGAQLTPVGLALVSRFRAIERAAHAAAETHLAALQAEIAAQ